MATTVNLGKVSITPRGAYSPSAAYSRLDLVWYAGSGYLALRDVKGVVPTDGEDYKLIVSKGDKGDKGDTGNTGSPPTITSQSIQYQVGNTGNTVPTGTWSDSIVTVPQGKYLWVKTTIVFQNSSPIVIYSASREGVDGTGTASNIAALALASTASAGTSSSLSRSDHVHPLPSASSIPTSAINTSVQDAIDTLNGKTVLYYPSVTCNTATNTVFATVTNAAITADHIVAEIVFSNPTAINGDVTWTTAIGSVTLSGTCTSYGGGTTANITLIKKDN